MVADERLYTVNDLWELSREKNETRLELIEGAIIEMSPAGDRHGLLANWTAYILTGFVETHDLGEVNAAETGFVLSDEPPTVVAPDVSFISKERLLPLTGKFYPIPPDLAVEVVSPNDSAPEVRRKVDLYLQAGTRLVWVIYPEGRLIDVYRPAAPTLTLRGEEVLDGGDVLPGFAVPVSRVFRKLRD